MSHFETSLASIVLMSVLVTAQHAYAGGSCIDSQASSDGTQTRWTLNNTCNETYDVSILSTGRGHHVCRVLRMEPNATRTFAQSKVCSSLNELTVGCNCEHELTLREQQVR